VRLKKQTKKKNTHTQTKGEKVTNKQEKEAFIGINRNG
jgi:hypothetical protein